MLDGISSTLANIVGWLIQKIFESIMAPFADIYTVEELIFGTFESKDTIYWRTFTTSELSNAFLPAYYLMMTVAGTMLVLFIIFAGMRVAGSSINANKRNELLEFTKELVLVGIGLYLLPNIYSLLFVLNSAFVDLFSGVIGTDIFDIKFDDIAGSSDDESLGETMTKAIGTVLVEFILFGIGIWANFYYLMRKITLLILLPLGPVMLVAWMFPAWKGVTLTYFKELTGTIFIQSIHAFTFWIVAVVSNVQTGIIATLIGFIIFIPISEQIRNLLGLSANMTGGLNRAGSMFGMAALGGMYGSVKGALNGESVLGSLKNLKDGGKKLKDGIKNGNLGDTLKDMAGTAKEAAFASTKSMDMEKIGDLVSKGGKAVGGLAGTFVGAPLGPVGSIAAAEAGSKIGGSSGGLVGRVGFAATSKVADMIQGGTNAVEELKTRDNEESVVNALSNEQAKAWGENSKAQIMEDLQQKFPTATQQELDKKFSGIVANKAKQFNQEARNTFNDAKSLASEKGEAEQLINTGASAMATAWEHKEGNNFVARWKGKNPRLANESDGSYEMRAQNALSDEKSRMTENFIKDGEAFARENADVQGNISRVKLAQSMANSALNHKGIGSVSETDLLNASKDSMNAIQGISLMKPNGQPNLNAIATNLAQVKTNQVDKPARINQLMSENGMSQGQAETVWRSEEKGKFAENFAAYSSPEFTSQIGQKAELNKTSQLARMGQTASTFVHGAVASDAQAIGTSMEILKTTLQSGAATMSASLNTGANVFESARNAQTAAVQNFSDKVLTHYGDDAVQAQQSIVQGAGYAAGILLGQNGRVKAQSAALSILGSSPMNQSVQSQIANASEILQMAHKVPDENGNLQVASGAIRQVTTRDKSFIEVRTASGEVQTISRIGAGSESLSHGETIYQDLTSSDGKTLEIATVGRSGVSTYKLDTGNGRIPVAHDVQNPMSLIGNTGGSHVETQQGYHAMPVLNQKVDTGQYFKEDLGKAVAANKFSNIQVVTTKAEQYLTGMNNEGQQVRLSPISQGDPRLGANQIVQTPVSVSPKGTITAVQTKFTRNGEVAGIGSTVITNEQLQGDVEITENIVSTSGQNVPRKSIQRNVTVSNPTVNGVTVEKINTVLAPSMNQTNAFVLPQNLAEENTASFNNLLKSKNDERIMRGLTKRAQNEQGRAKQGRP